MGPRGVRFADIQLHAYTQPTAATNKLAEPQPTWHARVCFCPTTAARHLCWLLAGLLQAALQDLRREGAATALSLRKLTPADQRAAVHPP